MCPKVYLNYINAGFGQLWSIMLNCGQLWPNGYPKRRPLSIEDTTYGDRATSLRQNGGLPFLRVQNEPHMTKINEEVLQEQQEQWDPLDLLAP